MLHQQSGNIIIINLCRTKFYKDLDILTSFAWKTSNKSRFQFYGILSILILYVSGHFFVQSGTSSFTSYFPYIYIYTLMAA